MTPGPYTLSFPPSLVTELGITFLETSTIVLADSSTLEVPVGVAYLRFADREGGIIVASMEVPMPLVGATALEVLGLKVNPVGETLEHSRPFGPAALTVLNLLGFNAEEHDD